MGNRRPGEGAEVDAEVEVSRIAPEQFTTSSLVSPAADLLRKLVADGAALGWVDPPPFQEVERLLHDVVTKSRQGDGCLVAAYQANCLVGLGYWRRYDRATHRPHADVEKIAVRRGSQGRGIGKQLMTELVEAATDAGVEVLTLDLREDNIQAMALYESMGFKRYGRLERFVAVGARRYDKDFYALDLRRPD